MSLATFNRVYCRFNAYMTHFETNTSAGLRNLTIRGGSYFSFPLIYFFYLYLTLFVQLFLRFYV